MQIMIVILSDIIMDNINAEESEVTCSSISNFNTAECFSDGIDTSRVGKLFINHPAQISFLDLEFDMPVKSVATNSKSITRVSNKLYRLMFDNYQSNITFIVKYNNNSKHKPTLVSVRHNNQLLCTDQSVDDLIKKIFMGRSSAEERIANCWNNTNLIEIHDSEETQRLIAASIKLRSNQRIEKPSLLEIVFDKKIYILGVSKTLYNKKILLKKYPNMEPVFI